MRRQVKCGAVSFDAPGRSQARPGRAARTVRALGAAALAAALGGCGASSNAAGGGIVSLAPHITEVVYAMDQGHRVVGRGSYDDYPPQVLEVEDVGDYLNPRLERIALLTPELVLLPGEHRKAAEFAALNQLPAVPVHMDSFETIAAGIDAIGAALGAPAQAAALNDRIRVEIEALRGKLAGAARPKVLIVLQRERGRLDTIFTAGRVSFVSEMVDLAGGENIFADKQQAYFEASKEELVERAPDIILEFHAGRSFTEKQKTDFIDDWMAMRELPAVQRYRIALITESFALRPGPRVAEMAGRIAKVLHPDLEWGA